MFVLGEYNTEIDIQRMNLRYIAPAVAAALIAGGTSIVGNVINRYADEQMIEKQNAYNDPSAVLERMYAAGLNPAAVAQSVAGNAGIGNMAAADYSNMASLVPDDLAGTLGSAYGEFLKGENVKADTAKKEEETRNIRNQNEYDEATFDVRVKEAQDRGVITEAEAKNARYLSEKYPEMIDLSVEEQRAEIDKKRSEKTKIDKEVDKIDQEIKESNKRIDKLEQDIKTARSQEALNYAQVALTEEKKRNQQLLNDKQEMENRREELTGSATGVTAAYFDIESKDGTEAADKWLAESNEVIGKVIKNSSKSSAEGRIEAEGATPEGQVKASLKAEMDEELSKIDDKISYYEKQGNKFMVDYWKGRRKAKREYYENRINKNKTSVGANVLGTGINYSN